MVKPVSKVTKVSPKKKLVVPKEVVKKQKDFKDYLNVFEFLFQLPGSKETIKFKPISIGALKGFLTYEGEAEPAEVTMMFDSLFEKVVISPEDFDPTDMYIYDRYALLLEIRKKTKGETNQFEMQCPECKGQSVQSINFEVIKIKPMNPDVDPIVSLTEHLSVKMRHMTRMDELEVYEVAEQLKTEGLSKAELDTEIGLLLESQTIEEIITPDGPQELEFPLLDKKYLLENIPQPLYEKIGKWHEDNKFGPDLTVAVDCPHCDFKTIQDITDLNFFS